MTEKVANIARIALKQTVMMQKYAWILTLCIREIPPMEFSDSLGG